AIVRLFNLSAVFSACLLSVVLSACGTKGPLYIPEKKYPQAASPGNQSHPQTEKARSSQP
ncbi:MAG TPA: lipoprotein, partial [Methyloradius sp.]